MLTQLKEQVNLSLVGIQALRMVDTETESRTRQNEQRIEDIERYLQLASSGQYPHPFQVRNGARNGAGHE
ncbi:MULTISPECIES: hypothetical protein [Cyanophyceae]|uniref:hypothetical protein n=1 Tax=Cyanophyceae TaxID=3028117 RepID=UPI0016894140|nr:MULTISPECIES: hypothetical protein [Cyanophyceae]